MRMPLAESQRTQRVVDLARNQHSNVLRELRASARDGLRRCIPRRRDKKILVYHMGKVGSTSIFESLVSAGVTNINHMNRMNPENIERVRREHRERGLPVPEGDEEGLRVYGDIRATSYDISCISPVRDPIRRNLSAFFFSYERFTGQKYEEDNLDIDRLLHCFLGEYSHDVPLTWFDIEMKQTLGVDVYQHPFSKETGFETIVRRGCRVLLLKCDLPDAEKESAIKEFLGLSAFSLQNENVGADKAYAETYKQFLKTITLPAAYLDRMCNSKYTRHFYSDDEIAAMRERWRSIG